MRSLEQIIKLNKREYLRWQNSRTCKTCLKADKDQAKKKSKRRKRKAERQINEMVDKIVNSDNPTQEAKAMGIHENKALCEALIDRITI